MLHAAENQESGGEPNPTPPPRPSPITPQRAVMKNAAATAAASGEHGRSLARSHDTFTPVVHFFFRTTRNKKRLGRVSANLRKEKCYFCYPWPNVSTAAQSRFTQPADLMWCQATA